MLTLNIYDDDILQKISQYATTKAEQESVALYAMRLGFEAIAAIRGEIDKEALQQVGEFVLERMQKRMETVLDENHETMMSNLHDEITRLSEKRSIQRRVTQGGEIFENDLGDVLKFIAQGANDIFQPTGTLTGEDGKVGDFIIILGNECHAPGEKIAIEAKRNKGYTLGKILEECKDARSNRGAQVCIFVWDKELSSRNKLPPIQRHENDIVVLWEAADTTTDIYLEVAYWLARSLVIPKRGEQLTAQFRRDRLFKNFDEVILQVEILETIRQSGERIRKEGKTVRDSCASILEVLREKISII